MKKEITLAERIVLSDLRINNALHMLQEHNRGQNVLAKFKALAEDANTQGLDSLNGAALLVLMDEFIRNQRRDFLSRISSTVLLPKPWRAQDQLDEKRMGKTPFEIKLRGWMNGQLFWTNDDDQKNAANVLCQAVQILREIVSGEGNACYCEPDRRSGEQACAYCEAVAFMRGNKLEAA